MNENDFESAKQASLAMFDEPEGAASEPPIEQPEQNEQGLQGEGQIQENTPAEPSAADMAASVAEQAAQTAQQMQQQLRAAQEENQHLQELIREQNEKQQEQITELTMPEMDFDAYNFATDEERQAMQSAYATQMMDFVRAGVMKDLEPALEMAKTAQFQNDRAAVIGSLKDIPELAGIESMVPQMDAIMKANPALFREDIPLDERYISAYAMARGVNAMNTPPQQPATEPTAEELIEMLNSNEQAKELYEKQRIAALKSNAAVPQMSASSGAVNAAINIPNKPKSWDDAAQQALGMFHTK